MKGQLEQPLYDERGHLYCLDLYFILVLSYLRICESSWNKIRKTIERRLFVRRLCREYFNEREED